MTYATRVICGLEKQNEIPPSLEYVACIVYLAFFAIIGVLSSYLLENLFGPSAAAVTSYNGILYVGLPANMVGSFLMGWFGVVFKSEISRVSDQLAIGLTSGYVGSLTAFSGWILQMIDLSVHGHWIYSMSGLVIGKVVVVMLDRFAEKRVKATVLLSNQRRTIYMGMLNEYGSV